MKAHLYRETNLDLDRVWIQK